MYMFTIQKKRKCPPTVLQLAFKLNSGLATADIWHLKGHKLKVISGTWGFHSSVVENSVLLWCDSAITE